MKDEIKNKSLGRLLLEIKECQSPKMYDEIKERLKNSLEYEFELSFNDRKQLLDYITNLQEENKKLEENIKEVHKRIKEYIEPDWVLVETSFVYELESVLDRKD